MEKIILSNNIPTILKINKLTPRTAMCFYFSINDEEYLPGTYLLLSRLFLQGTKTKTAEELATIIDENAIELTCDVANDFLRFRLVCLNEDFTNAIEILQDIIENSTFQDLEKEIYKLKGEIPADLDSPKLKAWDNYLKNIFEKHHYGYTHSVILDNLDNIKLKDIEKAYKNIIFNSKKVISIVGDVNSSEITSLIENNFKFLKNGECIQDPQNNLILNASKIVTITKEDAAQAQVIKGWIVPSFYSDDYPALNVFNTILGSCGLSSRLFLELREKKGLAYTVRSSYDSYRYAGNFSVYIGTTPKNIEVAIDGFNIEINKLKQNLVSDEELEGAKNNLLGKRLFFRETNLRQAQMLGLNELLGLGFDYDLELIKKIKSVKAIHIQDVANKYFNDTFVLSLLAPKDDLRNF